MTTVSEIMLRCVPIRWMVDVTIEDLESCVHPILRPDCTIASHRSLVLGGKTGTGKTAGIVLALRRYAATRKRYVHTVWHKARDLSLTRGFSEAGAVAERRDQAVGATILVIDDLGMELEWGILHEVLDERAEAKRITLVTTGLTEEQLTERYAGGFIRRIIESGREEGLHIEVPKDDWKAPWVHVPPKAPPAPDPASEFTKEEIEQQLADIAQLVATIGKPMPKAEPEQPEVEQP